MCFYSAVIRIFARRRCRVDPERSGLLVFRNNKTIHRLISILPFISKSLFVVWYIPKPCFLFVAKVWSLCIEKYVVAVCTVVIWARAVARAYPVLGWLRPALHWRQPDQGTYGLICKKKGLICKKKNVVEEACLAQACPALACRGVQRTVVLTKFPLPVWMTAWNMLTSWAPDFRMLCRTLTDCLERGLRGDTRSA